MEEAAKRDHTVHFTQETFAETQKIIKWEVHTQICYLDLRYKYGCKHYSDSCERFAHSGQSLLKINLSQERATYK